MATTVLGLKTFTASDPVDYNEINDNYNKIDNGVKTALQGRAAHNLLDNSDFANPVNQRGATSYTGAGYTIDRWKAGVSDCSMNVNAGQSVAFNTKTEGVNAYWRQYLPHSLSQLGGKTFTLAIKDAWGKTHCASGVYPTSAPSAAKSVIWLNMYDNISIVLYCATDGTAFVQLTTKNSVPIVWAALYEGSYDASTLPAYQPKGYAAELAECRRYYIKYTSDSTIPMAVATKVSNTVCRATIMMATTMRTKYPTINASGCNISGVEITSIGSAGIVGNGILLTLNCDASSLAYNTTYCLAVNSGGYIEISADL